MNLSEREANAVYDVLVRLAGASNRAFHRERFVSHVTGHNESQYAFCGNLGFGGKFFNQHGLWYVSTDLYDLMHNENLEVQVNQINGALYGLKAFFYALNTVPVD